MRLILTILFAMYLTGTGTCPPKGNSPDARIQNLDLQKNRIKPNPTPTATVVDISKFLAPGNDVTRFKTS